MTATIAPLLVKWLTHDLATPIATVMTASELLGDTADVEINGLITDAARRLGGRLQLVRAALAPGAASAGAGGIEKLLRGGLQGTPLTVAIDPGDVFTGPVAAVMTSAALLLADLRRFEPLVIAAGSARWATPALLPDAVAAALAGADATDARSALAAMVAGVAARAGLVLRSIDDGLAWN